MTTKKVRIFGIPMDLGQNRRGVDMGPSAIRYAHLQEKLQQMGCMTHDAGNILVAQAEEDFQGDADPVNAHYLPQVLDVCQTSYDKISSELQSDEFGLFLGGDHSISIGTVAAAAQGQNIGVIWVDAHTDMNTPTESPSGNIHGMGLAALLGYGLPALVNIGGDGAKLRAENVAVIGARSIDPRERGRVRESGIKVYTMRDIDERSISVIAAEVLAKFAHLDRIHVSFDLDSCDPRFAPGVGTPVAGGLTYREAHLLMELLADSGKVTSMDVVELNPILDIENRTGETAVAMILSLVGQKIL
ncbi:MAG: arginase [Aggregatilineales bacterium]